MVCVRWRRPCGAAGAVTAGAYDMCPFVGTSNNLSIMCFDALMWKRVCVAVAYAVAAALSMQVHMACNCCCEWLHISVRHPWHDALRSGAAPGAWLCSCGPENSHS